MKSDAWLFFDSFLLSRVEDLLHLLHPLCAECSRNDTLFSIGSDGQSSNHSNGIWMLQRSNDVFTNLFFSVFYRGDELSELCLVCLICGLHSPNGVCRVTVRRFRYWVWFLLWWNRIRLRHELWLGFEARLLWLWSKSVQNNRAGRCL